MSDEVIFTSGATEANNLALFGLCGDPPAHLLASPIEHPSVREPLRQLAESGFALDLLPVDAQGRVRVESLADRLRNDTRLVAVMQYLRVVVAAAAASIVARAAGLSGAGSQSTPWLAPKYFTAA